jgi:hypothetical protein
LMYFIRGAVIVLGVFFIVYVALSLLMAAAWRALRRDPRPASPAAAYGFRILPLVAALTAVLVFTIPSFIWLEPRGTDEPVGAAAFALASAGAAILVFGACNALFAWLYTLRCMSSWIGDSPVLKRWAGVPAYRASQAAPLLAVAGLCRPKLLVSSCAERVLDPDELEVALRHELAHVRRRDNLKKLALRACPFPLLRGLEREWLEAAERNADDEAVNDEPSALNLASALIKVSRLSPRVPGPELALDLVAGHPGAVAARVERLLAWKPRAPSRPRLLPAAMPAMLLSLVVSGLTYTWLLARVHQFTELLMR